MSIYLKIKFRAFGITWKTEIWRVYVGGFHSVDSIPVSAQRVFAKNGVEIYLLEG